MRRCKGASLDDGFGGYRINVLGDSIVHAGCPLQCVLWNIFINEISDVPNTPELVLHGLVGRDPP